MYNVFSKENKIKKQMINAILTYSDQYNSRKTLTSKNFSVLKFMYYDVMTSVYDQQKLAS